MSRALETTETTELVDRISSLLFGKDPAVQGAALACLTATWLAGHRATSERRTQQMREHLVRMHMSSVQELVRVEDAMRRAAS